MLGNIVPYTRVKCNIYNCRRGASGVTKHTRRRDTALPAGAAAARRGLCYYPNLGNGVDISDKDYYIQIIYIHNREDVLSR